MGPHMVHGDGRYAEEGGPISACMGFSRWPGSSACAFLSVLQVDNAGAQ